ncbi:MAG: helix-hairpin-helix domain-containing protein [Actinomycetota bacterium]
MTRVTASAPRVPFYPGVPEIIVPTSWRRRFDALVLRRAEIRVLAGSLAAVVVVAIALAARRAPATVAPPAISPTGAAASSAASAPAQVVLVHVSGAVRRPGLYELSSGARVADAIEAAGGPRPAADLGALNLAEVLLDAMKVDVVRRGAPAAEGLSPTTAGTSSIVRINSADQAELEMVPGIGPVKAGAIVQHRQEAGPFGTLEELLDVTGIGPATLEAIRPYIAL